MRNRLAAKLSGTPFSAQVFDRELIEDRIQPFAGSNTQVDSEDGLTVCVSGGGRRRIYFL